jgi:hypothetical protein
VYVIFFGIFSAHGVLWSSYCSFWKYFLTTIPGKPRVSNSQTSSLSFCSFTKLDWNSMLFIRLKLRSSLLRYCCFEFMVFTAVWSSDTNRPDEMERQNRAGTVLDFKVVTWIYKSYSSRSVVICCQASQVWMVCTLNVLGNCRIRFQVTMGFSYRRP